jgi:ubiquinone/menaquinone biosynthesis C-methylase UbiE
MQTKKFLDPEAVLFRTGLTQGAAVVDLGAGSGFFAVAAAQIVGDEGKVYVVDILEKALEHVSAQARLKNLSNIQTIRADLEKDEIKQIASGAADLVIAANIIHQLAKGHNLLGEVYRLLKTGGKLLVVEWNGAPTTIGPKHPDRVSEDDIKAAAAKVSLKFNSLVETDQYHYGLIFIK